MGRLKELDTVLIILLATFILIAVVLGIMIYFPGLPAAEPWLWRQD